MAEQQKKEYYSPAGHFLCRITRGEVVHTKEGVTRINEKFAEFQPRAAGDWGHFETDDPEIIAELDRRCNDGSQMVFTTEQFIEKTTPDAVKVRELKRQLAEANNKLAAQMQRKSA